MGRAIVKVELWVDSELSSCPVEGCICTRLRKESRSALATHVKMLHHHAYDLSSDSNSGMFAVENNHCLIAYP